MSILERPEYEQFENIRHARNDGSEYWSAREFASILGYKVWRTFAKVIDKAMIACNNSGFDTNDQFAEVGKLIEHGKNGKRKTIDYELSRYACYLIIQNGDTRKKAVALGQAYLAMQTYKKEMSCFAGRTGYAADLFCMIQAEEKLKRDAVDNIVDANAVYHQVRNEVYKTVKDIGGTMPEDLPTPEKSISQIEKEQLEILRRESEEGRLMLDE
ncbi:MAG: hypothetical protein FWD37_01860 [Methanomassiliicoccaceae archaeon]|nr:hypothetical protein [Methanomassiliicoccaceae archaeon]